MVTLELKVTSEFRNRSLRDVKRLTFLTRLFMGKN